MHHLRARLRRHWRSVRYIPFQSQHIITRAHTSDVVALHSCYVTSALYIFLFFFIPGLTIISLNAILFFFVIREIHETLASAPKTDKKDKKKEIRVYISIFISIGISSSFSLFTSSLAHNAWSHPTRECRSLVDLWFLHGPVPGAHRPADLLDPVLDLHARPGIPHLHLLLPQLQGAPNSSSPFLRL